MKINWDPNFVDPTHFSIEVDSLDEIDVLFDDEEVTAVHDNFFCAEEGAHPHHVADQYVDMTRFAADSN